MDASSPWRTINLGDHTPRLLIKIRLDDHGYDIRLTDLSRIWAERLMKDEIVQRASESRCSIDASEDDEQYRILLQKIESALSGAKGTTTQLNTEPGSDDLQLHVSAPLPGSLPTFKWQINLQKLPENSIASGLVMPLLQEAYNLQYNIQQLVDELSAKDRVISKITDRLESSGSDLTTVFPGVSNVKTNRKKSQREQLASHVKGLADFDEDAWRATQTKLETPPHSSWDAVLTGMPASSSSINPVENPEWWRHLSGAQTGGESRVASQFNEGRSNLVPPLKVKESTRNGVSDKQSVPNQPMPPAQEDDEEATETEDEDADDLDAPPKRTHNQIQQQSKTIKSEEPDSGETSSAPPKKSRLEIFGGKPRSKTPEPEPTPVTESTTGVEPSPRPRPRPKLGAFGGNAKSTEAVSEPSTPNPPTPKARGKLGAFGGKTKTTTIAPSQSEQQDHGLASPAKAHRLGRMGGSQTKRSASPPPREQVEDNHRTQILREEEREQEAERAAPEETPDEKRQRLKRELEDKSKAGTKKKRKF